jgi:hypothetical protein
MNRGTYSLIVLLALTAGLMGGVISSRLTMSQPVFAKSQEAPHKVVEAQAYRVVDKNGRVRAEMSAMGLPWDGLVMFDENGRTRLSLGVNPQTGPELKLYCKEGTAACASLYEVFGGVILSLRSSRDSSRALLGVLPKRGISLNLEDGEGNIRVVLELSEEGGPHLSLIDKEGKTRATLGSMDLQEERTGSIVKRPSSSLVLLNSRGEVIWQAP